MSFSVKDFFKPIDNHDDSSLYNYEMVEPYIKLAETFSKLINNSIYLIDYKKKGFLYVSDNSLFLCGKTAKQVEQLGYSFYINNVPYDDLNLLLKINEIGFNFFKKIQIEERLNYSISYDFRLKQTNTNTILINHKLAPITLDKNGNIWIAICIVTPSSNRTSGNIVIKNSTDDKRYEYDMNTNEWREISSVKLTSQEKQILLLAIQGYTIDGIADLSYITIDTVKFHRKNILKKLKVCNISEAIYNAINLGLI
ncbi:response regulator transcription factor [Siphonobacter sp. SORGH_AS_1065]|uniref:response regulator transcription factor n=1 Tax=Siphonobacter sp. SORGH_AS_1065 TaxID=3041795 RepID=UPI0027855E06|nr:helix-turn-helix transcriptional regulator [Siphonobacter sp. SORGH_AS_1065]MDQ1090490.1 DNA-binding CsgD family transcriptional regulator [Siphonobacter sp. SORGH_AS_1065]